MTKLKKERRPNGNVLQINEHTKSGENKQIQTNKKEMLFFDPCERNTFHFSLAIYFKGDTFLSPPSTNNSNGVERVESINT